MRWYIVIAPLESHTRQCLIYVELERFMKLSLANGKFIWLLSVVLDHGKFSSVQAIVCSHKDRKLDCNVIGAVTLRYRFFSDA